MKNTYEVEVNSEQEAMQGIYDDLRSIEKKNAVLRFFDNIKNKSSSKKIRKEFLNSDFLNLGR